jgi:hypothetical protein
MAASPIAVTVTSVDTVAVGVEELSAVYDDFSLESLLAPALAPTAVA